MSIGWLIAFFVISILISLGLFIISIFYARENKFDEYSKYDSSNSEYNDYSNMAMGSIVCAAFAIFLGAKLFCNLSISDWWFLLSPVWLLVAFYLPGGFTLTNWIFSSILGVMQVPLWVYIVGIVFDIFTFIVLIRRIVAIMKS